LSFLTTTRESSTETPRMFPSFTPKASQISCGIVTLMEFPILTAFILNSIVVKSVSSPYAFEIYLNRVYSDIIHENTCKRKSSRETE